MSTAHWCIHYNGTIGIGKGPSFEEGRTCRAGVEYRDVAVFPEGDRRLILAKLPCIGEEGSRIHGGSCAKREYPSPEEVAKENLAIERATNMLCPCCGLMAERVGQSTAYVCPTTKAFAFRACGTKDIGP